MENPILPADSRFETRWIRKIAFDSTVAQSAQSIDVRRRSQKSGDFMPLSGELADETASNKTTRACDQNSHASSSFGMPLVCTKLSLTPIKQVDQILGSNPGLDASHHGWPGWRWRSCSRCMATSSGSRPTIRILTSTTGQASGCSHGILPRFTVCPMGEPHSGIRRSPCHSFTHGPGWSTV